MSVVTITKDNFKTEVLESERPVLLDFWAPWCGPCRMLAPVIEELAKEYAGRAVVGKVNVDEEEELARQFRVMSIPTLIVFREGRAVTSSVGAKPKAAILKMLEG